jgi:hypothetical protein
LRCILSIFLLAVLFFRVNGNAPVLVLGDTKETSLFNQVEWYCDTSSQMLLHEIKTAYNDGKFKSLATSNLQIKPYTNYWIRFEAQNLCANNLTWMLKFNSQISHGWAYWFTPIDTGQAIAAITFNNIARNKVLLPFPAKKPIIYYIKIRNRNVDSFGIAHMTLSPQVNFMKQTYGHGFMVGLTFGAQMFILALGCFLYFNYRSRFYLYYIGYICLNIVFSLVGTFVSDLYLFSNNPWNSFKLYPLGMLGLVFYVLFVREFIGPGNIPQKLDRRMLKPFIVCMSVLCLLLCILVFVKEQWFWMVINPTFVFAVVVGAGLIIYILIRSKDKLAVYILTGSGVYCFFGGLSVLFDWYNLPYDNNMYNIGVLSELVIFAFAINYKQHLTSKALKNSELTLVGTKYSLENRQRELTQKVMHINQQDQILANLKNQLLELKASSSKDRITLQNVISDIDLYLKQDSWEDFEHYFTEVHPDFYRNIKKAFPDLSQNELRVCALIRLNLNTKQISDITRKTPKSIEVMRTRIRQKLSLTRDESLFDALVSF